MLPKLRNERIFNLTIKYNTRKLYYEFNSNHQEFPTDLNSIKLTEKMFALFLHQENTTWVRMSLRGAFKLLDKQDKKYFKKLEKQSKSKN